MDGVGVTKITVSEDVALVTFCRMPTDPSSYTAIRCASFAASQRLLSLPWHRAAQT